VDPEADDAPGYYEKITNPQDLGTIRARLQRNQYQTVYQWERDVNLVWSNCYEYNGQDSFLGVIAQELSRIFNKQCRILHLGKFADWLQTATDLYERLDRLATKSPDFVRRNLPPKRSTRLTARDLDLFSRATGLLNNREDLVRLIHISRMFGAEIDTRKPEAKIDMTVLPQPALFALVGYVKDRFEAMNLTYPK
jgi:hypothetical protein